MNPSLLLIPDRYKAAKLYSQIPDSGAGDLTFARNSSATRVNSAGLIEKVRTNFALYSEQFDNAAWFLSAITISANALTNPLNGASTADFLVEDTSTGTHDISPMSAMDTTTGISYTFSVYAKADTRTKILIGLGGASFNTGGNGTSSFDLSSGSVISTAGGAIASITLVSGGWYRCVITKQAGATGAFGVPYLQLLDASGNASYTGNGSKAAAFGWQFEVSDFGATPYIPTTTAAVSVGPVANIPRIDYTGGGCGKLLLEPQRTNLRTSSEQFSNLSPSNVTITSNDTTSPDGYANADKLTPSGSGFHIVGNTISVTAGEKYTISIFYKYGTHKNIGFYDNNTAGSEITINIETNAFTLGANVDAGGVIPYGNGWYRAYATFTAGNANMVNYIIFRDNTNNGNYTGDGSYSWFYGWQVEAGSYATSYIPTLGASVTRSADFGANTNTMQTAQTFAGDFTIYCDFVSSQTTGIGDPDSQMILGGGNQALGASFKSYLWLAANIINLSGDGETAIILVNKTFNANQRYKLCVTRNGTAVKVFCDGAQVGATATSSLSITIRSIGWSYVLPAYKFNGQLNAVGLYANGLSDSQAITLTTL